LLIPEGEKRMGGIRKMGEKKIQEKEGEMWKVDVIMFSSSFI